MKISKFPILISLITLLIVPSLVFGASRGYDYLTIRGLKIEAERLAKKGDYKGAIDRLSETEGQWTTESVRNEISQDFGRYEKLVESVDNFEQARIHYYSDNYPEAIELFKKVLPADVNFIASQTFISLAEGKMNDMAKGSTAGIKTEGTMPNLNLTPITNPAPVQTDTSTGDSIKAETLKNLFTRLGQLSGTLVGIQYAMQESAKAYGYDPKTAASYQAMIDSTKKQMNDIRDQILQITTNCNSIECANALKALSQLELEGYF